MILMNLLNLPFVNESLDVGEGYRLVVVDQSGSGAEGTSEVFEVVGGTLEPTGSGDLGNEEQSSGDTVGRMNTLLIAVAAVCGERTTIESIGRLERSESWSHLVLSMLNTVRPRWVLIRL